MPDRFSLNSWEDVISQKHRNDPEYEPECDCRLRGDEADASDCDLHLRTLGDPGDLAENRAPDPCPVRRSIFVCAETVGEMMDALKLHQVEYCEECGQLDGFVRPDWRKAA